MKLREQYARKRGGGEFDLVLDELKDTIASGDSVEAECERKEFAAAVNQFLCTLSADDRNIFVCRYWFFASIADIALRFKCSQSKVKPHFSEPGRNYGYIYLRRDCYDIV